MKKIPLFIGSFLLLSALPLQAVTTSFYNNSTIQHFQYGKLDRIMISENGELSLAPEAKTILDKGDLFVWDIVRTADGTIYAATGVRGKIYRITPDGEAALFYKTDGHAARALAAGKNGLLYAAASPEGTLLAIDKKGKAVKIATLKTSYIWDMVLDNRGGAYLATGNPARIVYVNLKNGSKKIVHSSRKESHFLCLGLDKAGTLYFGSSGLGALYKKIQGKKTRLIYDSYEDEISCLQIAQDGRVFFGTASQKRRRPSSNFNYSDALEFREPEQPVIRRKLRKKKLPLKNSVYMLSTRDKISRLMTLNKASVFSLALRPDGSLLIGTGDYGVVYRMSRKGERSRFLRLQEDQILCLTTIGDSIYAGTGNDGKIFALKKGPLQKGAYTSRILDCHSSVRWGTIEVIREEPAGTRVELETRTGNSETADSSWSEWSRAPLRDGGFRITSPGARYIQYRVTLTSRSNGSTPVVQSIRIPFLRQNRAPSIGRVDYKAGGSSRLKKKKKRISANRPMLLWTASDDDRDTLRFAVYFRFNNDPYWRLLKSGLQKKKFIFNKALLPDGWYRFKVVASDHQSNTAETYLKGSKSTGKILFDQSKPQFSRVKAEVTRSGIIISGKIKDALSPLTMLRYSINARSWQYASPVDSVFDSKTESFRIVIKRKKNLHLIDGNNLIILRAADKSKNWGIVRLFFNVRLKPGDAGTANDNIYFNQLEKETKLQ